MTHGCRFYCVAGLVLSIALTPLAAAADGPAFRHLFSFPHDELITCGDFSDDGKWLATGNEGGKIRLTDPESRQHREISDAHTVGNGVQQLRFTHDGRWLISGGHGFESEGGLVKVWATEDRSLKATLEAHKGHTVTALAVSSDDKYLVSADDQQVVTWDLGTRELKGRLSVPFPAIAVGGGRTLVIGVGGDRARVDNDQRGTVAGNQPRLNPGDLVFYDIEAGKITRILPKLASAEIIACRFHKDGSELFVLSADNRLYRLDSATAKVNKSWDLREYCKTRDASGMQLGSHTDLDVFGKRPVLLLNDRRNTFFLDLNVEKAYPFVHGSAVGICLSRLGTRFAVLGGIRNQQLAPGPEQQTWTVSVFSLE